MDAIRNSRIILGLAATPTSWTQIISTQRQNPLSRYFLSRVELQQLTEGEVYETIQKALIETGVSFGRDVIQRVFEYTDRHPFEMQCDRRSGRTS